MAALLLKEFKLRFEHLGIIDLEFTSWKGSQKRNWSLKWEKQEIINIGVIKFDKSFQKILGEKSFFFKPKKKKVSLYFQKLTSINQNKINSFKFLNEEDIKFLNFFFKDVKFILSNGIDKIILENNLKNRKIKKEKFFFIKKIINIKPFISKILKVKPEKAVSSDLLKLVGITKNKIFKKHQAIDDVKAIFLSLKELKKKGAFTEEMLTSFCEMNCE